MVIPEETFLKPILQKDYLSERIIDSNIIFKTLVVRNSISNPN